MSKRQQCGSLALNKKKPHDEIKHRRPSSDQNANESEEIKLLRLELNKRTEEINRLQLEMKTLKEVTNQENRTPVIYAKGWKDSGEYEGASYSKVNGRVFIDGVVSGGSDVMFTLPEGYRPSKPLLFAVQAGANPGLIEIRVNGEVALLKGNSETVILGLSFHNA